MLVTVSIKCASSPRVLIICCIFALITTQKRGIMSAFMYLLATGTKATAGSFWLQMCFDQLILTSETLEKRIKKTFCFPGWSMTSFLLQFFNNAREKCKLSTTMRNSLIKSYIHCVYSMCLSVGRGARGGASLHGLRRGREGYFPSETRQTRLLAQFRHFRIQCRKHGAWQLCGK